MVTENSAFTMHGGTISENIAENVGGVSVEFSGTFTMTGGSIIDNQADHYGGLFVDGRSHFELSGSPVIANNASEDEFENIFLEDAIITITGLLDSSVRLGVTMNEPATFTRGFPGNGTIDNFFSDYDEYIVSLTAEGELTLGENDKPDPEIFGTPDFVLPEELEAIEEYAFEGAAMSNVEVPYYCAYIETGAFKDCENLIQIGIPEDGELVGDVFEGCDKVYVFAPADSPAEAYCDEHDNCVFVEE